MASIPDVDVWSFEPSSTAAAMARDNIARNGLEDRIHLLQQAVGRAAAAGTLTVGVDFVNRLVDPVTVPVSAVEKVQVMTLDDALPRHVAARVSLVKIDVEGAEIDVLHGGQDLIGQNAPTSVVEKNRPAELEEFFGARGYDAIEYDPDHRALRRVAAERTSNANVIFARDPAAIDAVVQEAAPRRPTRSVRPR